MVTDEQLKNMNDEEFYETARAELVGLPRAQRRAKERELKENIKLMKSFNPAQLRLIDAVTSERSKLECEQQISRYITIMDTCLSAYMYLKDESITEDEVLKELKIIDNLVIEYRDVLNNIYKENRGNDEMAAKQIEKITKEVRGKCEELVKNGMNQSKALVILETQFPTLSKAMLVNAYKKVKKEMKENITQEVMTQEEKEVIEAAEYIFPEIKEEKTVVKDDKQKIQKELTEEFKKESDVITPIEEEKPVQVKSKLRRIEIREVFQGEFGEYVKTLEGVTVANKLYKDIESVDKESNDIIEKNTALIESYKASIKELNNKIDECNLTMSNVKAMSGEIKEVMLIG